MKILVTGAFGYVGLPLIYELLRKDYDAVGVDNFSRNEWVNRIGGGFKPFKPTNYVIEGDVADRDFVNEIMAVHKPDVIIHLASQPSMPYSHINGERALFTQTNNNAMMLNLLWGAHDNGLRPRFIVTTTTGIPGQAYESIPEEPVINAAGSFYHVSRGFDSANCALASRLWGLDIVEFRTSIVYGIQTELMRANNVDTRFDTDSYFGTVVNRFVHQALKDKRLTIYGKGEQTKPFISLNDTVVSIIKAIDHKFELGHTILNQVTENVSIRELAEMIRNATNCEIMHIENPRKENEEHKMVFINDRFRAVLGKEPDKMAKEVLAMIERLKVLFRADYAKQN